MRNICQKNTLILSGSRAVQRPFGTRQAWLWHILRYKDFTENLPEGVSDHVTVSACMVTDIGVISSHNSARWASSVPVSSCLKQIAGGEEASAEATLKSGLTAWMYRS